MFETMKQNTLTGVIMYKFEFIAVTIISTNTRIQTYYES